MAILGIRTAFGPKATAERREFLADNPDIRAENQAVTGAVLGGIGDAAGDLGSTIGGLFGQGAAGGAIGDSVGNIFGGIGDRLGGGDIDQPGVSVPSPSTIISPFGPSAGIGNGDIDNRPTQGAPGLSGVGKVVAGIAAAFGLAWLGKRVL